MTTLFEEKAGFWKEIQARVAEIGSRLEAVPIPPDPWLRGPNETDADIRRTINRLRAGVILPRDPRAVETLHIAKHLPAAKDPNSNLSEHIRNIDRARRQDHGRPRKRSKK